MFEKTAASRTVSAAGPCDTAVDSSSEMGLAVAVFRTFPVSSTWKFVGNVCLLKLEVFGEDSPKRQIPSKHFQDLRLYK